MGKLDPVKIGISAAPLVVGGLALYEGYLVVTDTAPFIGPDPINDFLKGIKQSILDLLGMGGGNGNPPCTKTCTAPQVIDEETCECVTPQPGCTTTCTSPQVLDPATCTCKTPTTPPPASGCYGGPLSTYSAKARDFMCKNICSGTRCDRYCFCRDCTTGPCA